MKRFITSFAALFFLSGSAPLLAQVTFPSFPTLLQINQTKSFSYVIANNTVQCDYTNPSFTADLPGVTLTVSTFNPYPACSGTGTITAGTTAGNANISFTGTDILGFTQSFGTGLFVPVYGVGSVKIVASGSTTAQANTSLATGALIATVYDSESTPVVIPGVVVTFATSAGIGTTTSGGAFPAAPGNMVTTSGSGTANSPLLTVDTVPGTFTATASAGSATSPPVTVTIVAGNPSTIALSAGSNQSTNSGNTFATNLQAFVKDSYGNAATSGTVTFTAPSTGPRGTFPGPSATATVNVAAGIATAPTLTAGPTAGAFSVTATLNSAGSPSVTFNLAVAAGLPASVSATAGSGQTVAVNSTFPTLLSATVLDATSAPVQFASVTFNAPTTGASALFNGASSVTVQTNASGVATVPSPMTANAVLGGYTVTATVSGVATPASFTLTNTAGAPANLTISSGAGQSTAINTAFGTPITATVTDSNKNPVANAMVNFSVATLSGGATATFSGTTTQPVSTNSSGIATAPVLTAGAVTGTLNVSAAVVSTSLSATTSSPLTITAGSPSNIAISAGNNQTVSVSSIYPISLAVKITDGGGNPINGVSVTFTTATVTGGANGNFASSTAVTTNAQGIATASSLTANGSPGVFTVSATASGSPSLTSQFTENISTGAASKVTVSQGNNQKATVNTAFPQSLQVLVVDAANNPVAGTPVTFSAPASGASAVFSTTKTNTAVVSSDSTGHAMVAVSAGATAGGPYTVNVTAGSPSINTTFTLTNQVGPATTIVIQSGNLQSQPVNMAYSPLSVEVVDSGGNPVTDGTSVTFTISPYSTTAASASFNLKGPTDTETTVNGIATSVALTADAIPGAFSVSVASGTAAPATFNLTNLAGTPAKITIIAGNNQSVTVNKQFPSTLQVMVVDGGGNPVANVPVIFAAPSTGATGTFAGSNSVATGASGTAVSPVFTANGTAGSYTVTASASSFAANFNLTNLPTLSITSVAPTSASESSATDQNVTITGMGFVTGDTVQFTRSSISLTPQALTNVTVTSPTSISGTIPRAYLAIPIGGSALTSPETDSITVTHPDGTTGSVSFIVNPPPTATSVSPTTVNVGNPSFVLTINGNNFNSGASVVISSAATSQSLVPAAITANSITVNLTPAILTTFAPAVAGAASSVPLNVVVQDGGSTSTLTGVLTLVFPAISGLNPTSVASGGTAFTLTVNGTNFLGTSIVHWCGSGTGCTPGNGDTSLTTTLTTNSSGVAALQASVPAALIATAGSATITVVNAAAYPVQTGSNQIIFNYGGLQLNSVSPTTVQAGSTATTINVTGANFQPDAVVHFVSGNQDTPLVTTTITINGALSTTQLSASIPAALLTSTGTASISVVNVADMTRSNALAFNIVQSAITTLSQSSAAAGTPGLTLTINGNNFVSGLTVQWSIGGTATPLTPSQVNASQVTVSIPASLLSTAGAAQIAVMNSGAVSSNSVTFTVNNPAITPPLLPTSAQLNQATFQLTVAGSNFLNGSIVQWNDGTKVTPLSTTFTSSTQLTALITPSLLATAETVVITVLNPGTGSPAPISNAVPFAVGPSPTILPISSGGLSPSTAAAGSPSFTLTVTGTNYTSTSVVVWDPGAPGTPTKLTTYLSDPVNFTTLTATVPAALLAAQGTAIITVQNTGPVTSNPVQFTITAGASPTITNLTPNAATAGATTPVQMAITGSSFQSGATVQWNGTGGTMTLTPVFVSAGQLNVTVPITLLATAGTASVTVTNPGGGVSNTATFTINPPNQVAITSLQVSTAAAGSGTLLDGITGQFFVAGSMVLWNNGTGAVPIATQYISSTSLTAVIPATDLATPGIAFISVQNPDKTVSNTELFTISGALPTIASLSQTSAPAGTAGFSLTITGTGYTAAGTTVLWGTMPLPTLVNSATSLTITLTSALLAAPGSVNVTVQTAGGTSNAIAFTIGGPTILVLAPSSATVGATGLTLSVGGANFITGATVMWGSTALTTTFVSASQLSAVVPAALLSAAGAINVTVVNPGGATSGPSPFTVGTGPAVASFTPTTVTAGSGAFTLVVTGTNFATGDQILWNGVPLTTTFSSATQLTGAVPANLTTNADTINIEVLHAGGVLSNLLQFVLAGPTVTSVSPTVAAAGSSSVQITVSGTNFIQQSVVQWNATAIPTAIVNSTTLTAQVGSMLLQTPGTAFLTVSNGTSTSAPTTFAVVAPTLSSISPGTAVAGTGALSLTVTGTSFAAGSIVNWNGTQVATSFVSATQLAVVVPANLTAMAGTNILTVTNPGGSSSGIAVFILSSPPPATITSFAPLSAVAGSQAFILTVNGTAFNSTSVVIWNGSALPTTFISATQITAFVNSTLLALPTQANVTVQNSGATAAVPAVFLVTGPTITSLSPSTTSAGGPAFNLSVTGSNFLPGSLIQWNSVSLPTAYNGPTTLTASVPASLVTAAGTASITVQNPGGATSPASTFTIGPFTLSFTTVSLPDAIVGQIYAAPALQATGGTSPYNWSITGGVIPQGLTLDPTSGTITGTATVPGIASLTIAVTDSVGRSVSKTLALHAVLPLTITNSTPLTPATISSAYSLLLIATGGTPPYTWSAGGSLPAGLLLNSTSGQISGTPLVPGLSQFTITATDSRSLSVTSPFSVTTTLQSVTIGGISSSLTPAQQPSINLSLGGPYTVDLAGYLNLAFQSAVGGDDQSIQFSTGGRKVAFTLPAGTTQPLYGQSSTLTFSTGTVAGNITVSATVTAGSANVTPTPVPSQSGAIGKAVPVLTAATLTRVTGGLNISITGYSTTREIVSATITFNPAAGSTVTSAPLTVQLSSVFTTWYSSAASTAVGSTFTITLPFSVSGNTNAIGSATITMTNTQGASQPITAMP